MIIFNNTNSDQDQTPDNDIGIITKQKVKLIKRI